MIHRANFYLHWRHQRHPSSAAQRNAALVRGGDHEGEREEDKGLAGSGGVTAVPNCSLERKNFTRISETVVVCKHLSRWCCRNVTIVCETSGLVVN
jgi:hypothetical protein